MKALLIAPMMLALAVAAAPAQAQQAMPPGPGGPGYGPAGAYGAVGDAGCGLGSMLFGAQPGMVQVLAGTTNFSFGSQTFAITSGTSNCGASGAIVQAKEFVEGNRDALAKDISRGRGETISSLSHLAGCHSSAHVGRTLQRNYGSIFPNAAVSDRQVGDSVVKLLKRERGLSCNKLDG